MSKPAVSLSILAYRLTVAMSLDVPVAVTLRSRPVRTVTGKVTYKRIDERKKIDPKQRDRSNLIFTVAGVEYEVERMSDVRLIRDRPA